jgi:energy-coupling factor transport system permease protein
MIVLMSVKAVDLVTVMHKAKIHYTFSYATMIALNFIPEFATAARTVLNAQQARGLDVTKQNFIVGIRNMAQLMPPLLTMVFRKAETLSLSMDALAFGAKDTRTYIRSEDLYLRPLDYAVMVISFLFLVVYIIIKYAI